jgi:hypothetical protein
MLVLATASGVAQQPTGFSGVWVATKDAPASVAAAPSPVMGAKFALKQAGTSLTLTRARGDVSLEITFEIGGPETRMWVPGTVCAGDSYTIEKAAMEGSTLVLTRTGTVIPGGGPSLKLNVRTLLRLEAPDTLVVEGSMGPAPVRQVATVYKRSTDPMPPLAPSLPASKASATIADVAWIGGTWAGSTATSLTEERWTPPAGGVMIATARTVRTANNTMAGFEFLCIAERDGGLVYQAMPGARTPATDFYLTSFTPDAATFENPAHDYPKKIRYSKLADGSLETVTSGAEGSRTITVVLKKQ